MTDIDNVFLTDTRRKVLNGEYTGSDNNERTHKSNIRKRARLALKELIEVAESDEIDNIDVFHPDDLAKLMESIIIPPDGFTPRWNFDGDSIDYLEAHKYQYWVANRLGNNFDTYRRMLEREVPPGEDPGFGDLPDFDE